MGYLYLRHGSKGIHFYPPGDGEKVSLAGGDPVAWDGQGLVMADVSALIVVAIFYNLGLDLHETVPPGGKFWLFGRHVEIVDYAPQLDAVYLKAI